MQNLSLKCCQSLELLIYVGKSFRSFHTCSIRSVGQRVAKLTAVKVGGLTKKSANSTITAEVCASAISPGSTPPEAKAFSKFDGR